MKTTSYIIIGLLGLGAVGAFGIGAYVGSAVDGVSAYDAMKVAGEISDTQVGKFAVLDTEVKRYCDTLRMDFVSELVIKVSEDASLETPRLTMNVDWDKYLTVRELGDSLILDFDFHEYMPGKTFTRERVADSPTSMLEQFFPADIAISVPRGMLKSVTPDQYTRLVFDGMEADSLDFGMLTSMTFDKCRIGALSFSGDVMTGVINDYGYNISNPEAGLKFNESQIGLLSLDVPAVSVDVTGGDSMIEKVVWNDASTKGDETAYLNAPRGLFHLFEWRSPKYENTLQYQLNLEGKGAFSIVD